MVNTMKMYSQSLPPSSFCRGSPSPDGGNILVWDPLEADPEARIWVQVVYLRIVGWGSDTGKEKKLMQCADEQVILVGNWGSIP